MSSEWIVFAIVVALLLYAITIYNRLVFGRNGYRNAFAQIDVQLTRRHDLIPNLVETAKGYMAHERETFEAVIAARNAAVSGLSNAKADPGNAEAIKDLAQAEQGLGSALGRLFALSEAYPELKANQNMMQLSEELSSTENKVAFAKQAFNDAVLVFNNLCEKFPGNLVARQFDFKIAEMLEIEDVEVREAPGVSFS
jgi:LemA protein